MQQPEADRLVQLASAEFAAGNVNHAAALLDNAYRADPRHPMVFTKQAELAMFRKDHGYALKLTATALQIEPHFAPALHQRAAALWAAGRQADAVPAALLAVHIQPPNPDFRLRFAQFAAWTGLGDDARVALNPLLDPPRPEAPHFAPAVAMRGELAIAEGRFEDALPDLDRALALQPSLAVTRMLRGMNRLRLGRFTEGWVDYAARETIRSLYPDATPRMGAQVWRGENLTGKTLLVTDDQGHGDAIQFFRYLPMLRDRGAAAITWQTFPALQRLFAASAPYAKIVNALSSDARFDFQCTSTTLPASFGTELTTIPTPVGYLRPRDRVRLLNRARSGQPLEVGLVWSGDRRHVRDHLRSIPADQFLKIAEVAGIRFHSLQHEVRATDLAALTARETIGRAVEDAADFADTASLISGLDLVIAVDTGIAHLAAAMGKPVWLMLHVAPDWRWLADQSDSPWYHAMRLFRVTPTEWRSGVNWAPVLERVRIELRASMAHRSSRLGKFKDDRGMFRGGPIELGDA